MINQAITDLNELSELLNEVSSMIDDLNTVPTPVDILVQQTNIIFDVDPVTQHDVLLPRNAKIISMIQNLYSPKKISNLSICAISNSLTAKINIEP